MPELGSVSKYIPYDSRKAYFDNLKHVQVLRQQIRRVCTEHVDAEGGCQKSGKTC